MLERGMARRAAWGIWLSMAIFNIASLARGQAVLDWQAEVREKVQARQLDAALGLIRQRLARVPGDLEARGNLSDHEYTVTRDGAPVAQISKQWFSWSDTYGVDISDKEDPVLILASTVVIDMCCHQRD